MKYVYPAIFYKEEDGRYSVLFPDFDVATCGDDLDDAIAMAEECLALQLKGLRQDVARKLGFSDIRATTLQDRSVKIKGG